MSRTIRLKKYSGSQYWYYRWNEESTQKRNYFGLCCYGYGWIKIDKDKDPHKWKQAWWHFHSESNHANLRSPSADFRSYRERQLRNISKKELHAYERNHNYEVMIPDNPYSHSWDWD